MRILHNHKAAGLFPEDILLGSAKLSKRNFQPDLTFRLVNLLISFSLKSSMHAPMVLLFLTEKDKLVQFASVLQYKACIAKFATRLFWHRIACSIFKTVTRAINNLTFKDVKKFLKVGGMFVGHSLALIEPGEMYHCAIKLNMSLTTL